MLSGLGWTWMVSLSNILESNTAGVYVKGPLRVLYSDLTHFHFSIFLGPVPVWELKNLLRLYQGLKFVNN